MAKTNDESAGFRAFNAEVQANISVAENVFSKIADAFPKLRIDKDIGLPVETGCTIPIQDGLNQEISLYLAGNDELHLQIGEYFRLEWFPCSDPSVVLSYFEAVAGFISGQLRLLEHYRGRRCVKAELQRPHRDRWETIGTWTLFWPPLPWKKSYREVSNR